MASSAWVPPVEAPMAISDPVFTAWRLAPLVNMASAVNFCDTLAMGAMGFNLAQAILALAAVRMAATRSEEASGSAVLRFALGLATTSIAPRLRACNDVLEPSSVSVEHMTTGVGRSVMIFFKKVMPSMRGISTSRVMTSGQSFSIFAWVNIGSWAEPITSMPVTPSSISVSTFLTTAESSIINTRIAILTRYPKYYAKAILEEERSFAMVNI